MAQSNEAEFFYGIDKKGVLHIFNGVAPIHNLTVGTHPLFISRGLCDRMCRFRKRLDRMPEEYGKFKRVCSECRVQLNFLIEMKRKYASKIIIPGRPNLTHRPTPRILKPNGSEF